MEVFREPPGSAELSAFCKQDASKQEFSAQLRNILEVTAMTGLYWHEWDELKMLLSYRLKQVLRGYHKGHMDVAIGPPRPLITGESYQELEDRLTSGEVIIGAGTFLEAGLDSFVDGAPFTIQRLCELLLNPRDRYPNLDKVALAFEKLLLVTSTVPPSTDQYPATAPAPTKEEDKQHEELPKADNMDTTQEEAVSTTASELPSQTQSKEPPAAGAAPDEVMEDVESMEAKEPVMEADVPQTSETTLAGETLQEIEVKAASVARGEWPPVEAAIGGPAAPLIEEDLQSVTMVDSNPD